MRETLVERQARFMRLMAPGSLGGRSPQVSPVYPPLATLRTFNYVGQTTALQTFVRRSTNQTISNAATNVVSFDTVVLDELGAWNAGTPDLLTIPVPGMYVLEVHGQFAANTTGLRRISTGVDRLGTLSQLQIPAATGGPNTPLATLTIQRLVAGDLVRHLCYQTSGGNLTYVSVEQEPYLSVVRLSD
jgi:hypothetical protein